MNLSILNISEVPECYSVLLHKICVGCVTHVSVNRGNSGKVWLLINYSLLSDSHWNLLPAQIYVGLTFINHLFNTTKTVYYSKWDHLKTLICTVLWFPP